MSVSLFPQTNDFVQKKKVRTVLLWTRFSGILRWSKHMDAQKNEQVSGVAFCEICNPKFGGGQE